MAQQIYIPVVDDNEILSESPLVILDTKYYEVWYRQTNNSNWSQLIANSPLPEFTTVSPAGSTPCIVISPLPDATDYQFQVRRFDSNNNFSAWTSGTFTTGSSS